MASFADLVKSQRESGKSALLSLSSAYNQQQMEKFDVRNKLFKDSGLMTALFPSLKGYKAKPISAKERASVAPSPIMQSASTPSPITKAIARDLRISARNSMVLPSIARNMATLVTIWGGKAAKVPKGYTEAPGGGAAAKKPPGKSGGGSSILGGVASGIGGMLGGVGSILGSVVGGLGSVIGSILGGVGSLLGGAASGIMGILGSALSGMGLWGVLIAGVAGFALYSIFKGVDFSSLGKGIGGVMESIQSALSGLFNDLDDMSGGRLSEFLNWTKNTMKGAIDRIAAGIETAMELFTQLGTAVLIDMKGFFTNFFQENKGKIFALMAIGLMGPRALLTLPGAAIATIAGLVGAATGERSIDELKSENEALKKEYERRKKEGRQETTYDAMGNVTGTKTVGDQLSGIEDKIKENERQIAEKESRTTNTKELISGTSFGSIGEKYQQKLAERQGGSPSFAGKTIADFLSAKEGFSGKAYLDPPGNSKEQYSIGYGHLISPHEIKQGYISLGNNKKIAVKGSGGKDTVISKEEAKMLLENDIPKYEKVAAEALGAEAWGKLNQDQRNALTSLVYNSGQAGINHLIKKGLRDAIMKGDTEGASQIIRQHGFTMAGGKQLASLQRRRGEEATLFAGAGTTNAPQLADNKPTPVPAKTEKEKTTMSDTVASLAYDQVRALDRMMGGRLMNGSTELADMLRDITKEFMNNPVYDNSTTVNNNNMNGGSSVSASTYDSDILKAIMERKVWNA